MQDERKGGPLHPARAVVGLILDARTGGTARYDITDFTVAMSVQYVVGLIGLVGILRTRRLTRRRLTEQGMTVRPIREILAERGRFSLPGTGKPNGLERQPHRQRQPENNGRQPEKVTRGGHG